MLIWSPDSGWRWWVGTLVSGAWKSGRVGESEIDQRQMEQTDSGS